MIDHDKLFGSMLDMLDDAGLTEDTIVLYSTDNGPHMNSWPDSGMAPFRSEKNSNWEGAYRVPAMVRWPGTIPAGRVLNGIMSHNDWFITLLAAAGDPDIAAKPRAGHKLGGTSTFNLLTSPLELAGCIWMGQSARLPVRRGRPKPTPVLLPRVRRRRPHRPALRQLEVRLP
jgi:arylsulfatase A-like enzyme